MGKLLNQTNLTIKQQEYVDSILLSGEALLSVINDILDISKIESSRMMIADKNPPTPRPKFINIKLKPKILVRSSIGVTRVKITICEGQTH